MPQNLLEVFPMEVIDIVLMFLSKRTLATLYDGLSEESVLKPLVFSRMFKHMKVDNLEQLIEAASLDARVGTMHLEYKDEYLSFFQENPAFTSCISDIKLTLPGPCDYTVFNKIPLKNVSHVELKGVKSFDPSRAPRNLKLINLFFDLHPIPMKMEGWPPSLSSLVIQGHNNLTLIELPKGLKELTCSNLQGLCNQFPSGLEKLELILIPFQNQRFPNSIKELLIDCRTDDVGKLLGRLPSKLKKLSLTTTLYGMISSFECPDSVEILEIKHCIIENLGDFKLPKSLVKFILTDNKILNLQDVKYPESLQVLNLNSNGLRTLHNVDLPKQLRELYVADNYFTSLEGVTFPELEILDITTNSVVEIKSMKNAILPSTLKVLKAGGHCIGDYE